MPLEPEITFEAFDRAERIPSSLPWAVYHAVDGATGKPVRLAVLWAGDHLTHERRRAALDWFAEAASQIERLGSPVLPAIVGRHSGDDHAYVATERPRGRSLNALIAETGPLTV